MSLRSMGRGTFVSLLVLITLATCKSDDHDATSGSLIRSTPAAVSDPNAWALFDRSLSSGYVPDGRPVTVTLPSAQLLLGYKVNGPAPYRLSITGADGGDLGFDAVDLSRGPRGWQMVPSNAPVHVEKVQLAFTPLGNPGPVPELELWTDPEVTPAADVDLTADSLPSGFLTFKSDPGPDALSAGTCHDYPLDLAVSPTELVRAYVVYTAQGAFRSFSLGRSVNGLAAVGGRWLAGDTADHVFVDEFDPGALQAGANSIRLCVPPDATNRVSISKLHVVGEIDRGMQFASRVWLGDEQRDGSAVVDANTTTTAKVGPSEPILIELNRLVAPDAVHLVGSEVPSKAVVECLDRQRNATPLHAHTVGADIEFDGAARACAALRLTFEVPVEIAELRVIGSGAGDRVDWPRLVITSPPEHFGEVAWVGGFTVRPQSASSGTHVVIAGKASESLVGEFGDLVERHAKDSGSAWSVDVDATYADGTTETRTIVFDRDQRGALAAAKSGTPVSANGNDARFASAGASVVVHAPPTNRSEIRLGTSIGVDVPVGAVTKPTDITVRHLGETVLPPLDAGMINVTAPRGHGYEFLPHGQRFAKPVETLVPFDPSLIPASMSADDVHTYYFDPAEKHWKKLDRTAVDVGAQVVHSATDHFTIMIDAVLAVPANPTPAMMDPTRFSAIPAASPAAGIDLIEPPQASSMGDARVALPIRLPAGRGAFSPSLSLSYSSASENGWLGVGWNLDVSKVEIDTRWGVPSYADGEVVRYLLDGAELVPTADSDGPVCSDGSTGRRYHPRVEGSFTHILRCGADPSNYWFEAIDTKGTLFVYGNDPKRGTANADLLSTKPRPATCSGTCPPGVFRWHLNRVDDIHGNETTYTYVVDDITGAEPGRDVYLTNIAYTSNLNTNLAPYFNVDFILDGSQRPDKIISGRGGFKQVTRKLLHSVKVRSGAGIVRQYVLTYAHGQFEKTVLTSIREFGISGCSTYDGATAFTLPTCNQPLLDEHTLNYMTETQGFDAPVAWTVNDDPQEAPVLGTGHSSTNFGSLSVATPSEDGAQGELGAVGINTSEGTRTESVGMYDLNGDGLPDQAYCAQLDSDSNCVNVTYTYNQRGSFSAAGGPPVDSSPSGAPTLGKESHASWGVDARVGIQPNGWGATANGGYSNSTSRAKKLLLDADGDGYVDVIDAEAGNYRFSGPCTSQPSHQCFTNAPFGVLSTINPGNDLLLNADNADIKERAIPGDPVVQWTAPYSGQISITGSVRLLAASTNGVTATVYHDDTALFSGPITSTASPFTFPPNTSISVIAGEELYLRVANGGDDGAASDGLHNKVNASMSVSYTTACDDILCGSSHTRNASAHEPTGRSVYDFDLFSEQRLNATTPTTFPVAGHVRLHGKFVKVKSAADLTVCIEHFAAGSTSTDVPCSTAPTIYNQSGPFTEAAAGNVPIDIDFDVSQGDRLVLRAESAYSFDPLNISFAQTGGIARLGYTSACDLDSSGSGSSCTSTIDPGVVPLDLTSFGIYAVPVTTPVTPPASVGGLPLIGAPPYPFIVDNSKPYSVLSFNHPFNGALPITIAARSDRYGTMQFITCPAGQNVVCNTTSPNKFSALYLTPGDSLSFEVLPSTANTTLSFPASVKTITIQLDSLHQYSVPLIFRNSALSQTPTPFAGGFRGWRNAFWNERDAFTPTEVLDYYNDPQSQPNTNPIDIARTVITPIASFSGTAASIAPAWVSKDADAFIATSGDMNGASIGGSSTGGLLPEGGLFEDHYARLSGTRTYFVGGGVSLQPLRINGSLNASIGQNDTKTTTDLLDIDGDGIVDVVAGNNTYAGRLSSTPGPQLPNFQFGDGFRRRSGYDYSFGGGGSVPDTSAAGRAISMYVPPDRQTTGVGYSTSVGLQMGRSEDTDDLMDINGDGLPDMVQRRGTSINVRYNLGNQFGALETIGTLDANMNAAIDTFQSLEQTTTPSLDTTSNALSHETTLTEDDSTTLDVVFVRLTRNTHQTSSRITRQIVDLNGDGLPDLLLKKSGQPIQVQFNRGGDFGASQPWTTPSWGTLPLGPSFSSNYASLLLSGTNVVADNDVLAGTSSQSSRTYTGEVVFPLEVVNLHVDLATTDADDTYELALMDVDGDGAPDHVLRRGDVNDRTLHVKRNQVTGRANLLQTVHRPLGGSFTLDYTWAGNTQDMPHRRQVLSRVEVDDGVDYGSSFASPNLVTTFAYDGGYYHRNEKTFMGFSKVTTFRADGGYIEQFFENHSLPLMGRLTRETRHGYDYVTGLMRVLSDRSLTTMVVDVVDGSNTVIGATPECLAALPGLLQRIGDEACRPKLPVLVEDDSTQVESGGLKTHIVHVANLDASGVPQIDRFGNVLNSTDEVDDDTTLDDIYAEAVYQNNTTHWVLGIPIRLVVRDGGPTGAIRRSRSGLPDLLTGDLTSITVQTGTSAGAKTLLTYDPAYGTLSTITTPANKKGDVQTYTIKYDSSTQTYPISVTNAFGDVSATSYDVRYGIPTVETDPSGGRIIRTLDSFGRVHTIASNQDPTGTYTLTMDYYQGESPPRAVTTARGSAISTYTGPLAPTTTTAVFTDGLGRAIETRDSANVGGNVGTTTSGAVQRDNMGHVTASYQPFFNQGASTTFLAPVVTPATITGYDSFDRARSVAYPDTPQPAVETTNYDIGASPSGHYLFHTTVTEPNTHYHDVFIDSANRTLEYIEHASNPADTTYDYLPTGELAQITDAEGNQTAFQYDLRGLRLVTTSPDAGTVTQTFDDMGNRTSLTDANHANAGTTINYTYSYDRLTAIDYPTKADVAFTYAKGRIRQITDETGTRTFTYGSLGEVKDDLRTVKRFDGTTLTFDTKFTYDTLGRLLQVIYPEGTSVTNAYDEGGKLASVTGSGSNWSRVYADQIQYDVFGNRTKIHYGNNVLTTEQYEPLRVRLSQVQTTLPSGDQVQNLAYQYDAASNPTLIKNTLPSLTSSSGYHPGQSTLTLTYDGADQLFTAAGSADLDATTKTTYTETTNYSPSHNISSKQRVHQLTVGSTTTTPPATNFNSSYTYNSGHAHLPSLISPTTYDASGNPIGSNSISYDANGNPTQRSDTSGSLQTLVWDDDNRLTQVNGSFGTQTDLYDAGGLRVRRDSGSQHTIFESQYFDLEGTNQSVKHIFAGSTRIASVLDTNFVGGANPPASSTSGTPYFFHDDHLGSTTVVTTDAGAVQESHEYFSDGELWIDRTPQPAQNRYLFDGKPFDRDTGFYDFGQRFYEPRTGLWLGLDSAFLGAPAKSVGRPMMLSLSAFAGQSPMRIVDPDGRDYPTTQAGKQLYGATLQSHPTTFVDPKGFSWDAYAKSAGATPDQAFAVTNMATAGDRGRALCYAASTTLGVAVAGAAVGALLPVDVALGLGIAGSSAQTAQGIQDHDPWEIVGGVSGLLLAGGGTMHPTSGDPIPSTTSTADARFQVTPDGVAIPTNPEEVLANLSKLKDVSTNPSSSRKFTGTDSKGPIRVRIEQAHPEDPAFTGEPDPLHTVDHMHIDRRANGMTGAWGSKEKIPFRWPF